MRAVHAREVTLEPQAAAHAEAMFAVLGDPALYSYLDEAPPASVDALRERYRRLESRASPGGAERWLNWVVRAASGEAIGYVQATVRGPEADIAFVVSSAWWGKGLAFDAVDAMMQELAERHGVTRFFAAADHGNRRAIKLLKRLGFHTVDPPQFPRRPVAEGDVLMSMAAGEEPP